MKIFTLHKNPASIFIDYVRCVYFESRTKPQRAFKIVIRLLKARTTYDIGPLYYSLFRFSDIPIPQWKGYLTDEEFFRRGIKTKLSQEMIQLVGNKALFHQRCLERDLPTIPVICLFGNPRDKITKDWFTYVSCEDQLKKIIETGPDKLFIKPIDGSHGEGSFVVQRLNDQQLVFGDNRPNDSPATLYSYLRQKLQVETGFLVQPLIQAHRELCEVFKTKGLATARVVTALIKGEPKVLVACARLPVGENINDNFANGATGNLVAAIDLETGILSRGWSAAQGNWPIMKSTDIHPDTRSRISGFKFPLWLEVVNLALRAQENFPDIKTVGWDIAVTDEGPLLIEANGWYDIGLLQVAHQRGLGHELLAAIAS